MVLLGVGVEQLLLADLSEVSLGIEGNHSA